MGSPPGARLGLNLWVEGKGLQRPCRKKQGPLCREVFLPRRGLMPPRVPSSRMTVSQGGGIRGQQVPGAVTR